MEGGKPIKVESLAGDHIEDESLPLISVSKPNNTSITNITNDFYKKSSSKIELGIIQNGKNLQISFFMKI
jgi:hypothetical protein